MPSVRYRSLRYWLTLSEINTTTSCYYCCTNEIAMGQLPAWCQSPKNRENDHLSIPPDLCQERGDEEAAQASIRERGFFEWRLAFWVVHKKFHHQKIFELIIFAHFLCGARRPDILTNITGIFTLIFLSLVNMEQFRMTQIWEHFVWVPRSPIAFWEWLKKLYAGFLIDD